MWNSLRRHPWVIVVIAVLVVTALVTSLVLAMWARRLGPTADQLAAAGVVLTGGTFGLALIAAVLAAIAYAQSVRRPAVRVRPLLAGVNMPVGRIGSFPDGWASVPGATLDPATDDARRLPPLRLDMIVSNDGDAAARNVTLTVDIDGLQVQEAPQLPEGWRLVLRQSLQGFLRLEWDGGADLAVHPGDAQWRWIERVILQTCAAVPGTTVRVQAKVVADGSPAYFKTTELAVN